MKIKISVNKVWRFVTSPDAVFVFNIAGLTLQLLHQVEAFRRGSRTVGFKGSAGKQQNGSPVLGGFIAEDNSSYDDE